MLASHNTSPDAAVLAETMLQTAPRRQGLAPILHWIAKTTNRTIDLAPYPRYNRQAELVSVYSAGTRDVIQYVRTGWAAHEAHLVAYGAAHILLTALGAENMDEARYRGLDMVARPLALRSKAARDVELAALTITGRAASQAAGITPSAIEDLAAELDLDVHLASGPRGTVAARWALVTIVDALADEQIAPLTAAQLSLLRQLDRVLAVTI